MKMHATGLIHTSLALQARDPRPVQATILKDENARTQDGNNRQGNGHEQLHRDEGGAVAEGNDAEDHKQREGDCPRQARSHELLGIYLDGHGVKRGNRPIIVVARLLEGAHCIPTLVNEVFRPIAEDVKGRSESDEAARV
eukprot:CAMPEP_0180764444 /NCGR_PEP_ID=MMETSP1038_2-20121128/38457_1 /TAXON_ID=632150 /ORGANISM="Azadinium spinosum, Strain 3D9" /LENGTH=139 /DNA_ID=CAMNT_0022798873 /DNA_START=373 /DNA_END=792 /DNA_ORIENTATION=-